ncbi:apicoplast ribosomal protein L4, putative (apicoplast) [Plasmodium gallinaceum]|uniref:Apicoplast ribosomal protein L4, putative n=1 Tax=Plasmodium gallinaceum TaxID=5849 RepID=H7CDW8_PLAGA|nr:apicoplast ribosomal protein L4, putative [Plasmodium gallinaceum]BAL70738.1 large subunit ribosomal protein 4 [Plasmodium gallinaceum]CRG98227.1 apicoplast ribosomal protein L4, putative [Plasmodium gallinaceum]
MNIIMLNINNNIFNIIFKYKYNFFIKLYLNNYIKTCKLLVYILKYYFLYDKNRYKHTKNKSLINFSNKKIRIQKGLGKSRLRNFKSPICKQGSCNFGPFYTKKIIKYNNLKYKLVFLYLLLNKRSNIIIIKLEDLIKFLNYMYNYYSNNVFNLNFLINKIIYFNGILNRYLIIYLNQILNFNSNIILNLIKYNYIIIML